MKKVLTIIGISIVGIVILAVLVPFISLKIKTTKLKEDYAYLKNDVAYQDKVEVEGIALVTQHVSCGYASIEMVSTFYGNKVSEDELDSKNKSISTSSSNGFLKEINASQNFFH